MYNKDISTHNVGLIFTGSTGEHSGNMFKVRCSKGY